MEPHVQKKREMAVTPFAAQLDEIDKALFEYRYRKQTHQYGSTNTKYGSHQNRAHQGNQGNGHRHHQAHHGQLNGQQYYNGHHSGYGMKSHHGSSQRVSPGLAAQPQQQVYGQMHHQKQHVMAQQPQQMSYQVQQSVQQVQQVQQPQQSQHVQALHQQQQQYHPQQQLYGMTAGSVVARSPDSFVEGLGGSIHSTSSNGSKIDGFSLNLSSSISSGAGSTSSYSSMNEYDMQNKVSSSSMPMTFGMGMNESHNLQQSMGSKNDLNVINENNGFESFNNVTNNSNRGWLNIWGSDMSVWG